MDNRSTNKASDVVSSISKNGLSISAIGMGDPTTKSMQGLDETGLKSLATQAGGAYSPATDQNSLTALFQQYGRTLQSEYALTYTSPSALRDGVNRNLSVSLTGGAAATQAKYNPGGVLPEVSGQSWLLFGAILVGLLVLLLIPGLIGLLGSRGGGGGLGRKKGRVKLNSQPASNSNPSRSHVKMK
jgi:hypothetical protein